MFDPAKWRGSHERSVVGEVNCFNQAVALFYPEENVFLMGRKVKWRCFINRGDMMLSGSRRADRTRKLDGYMFLLVISDPPKYASFGSRDGAIAATG